MLHLKVPVIQFFSWKKKDENGNVTLILLDIDDLKL